MYFKIVNSNNEIIREFIHTFPEIEIVEDSINGIVVQTCYHLSSTNIRKLKLLNISTTNGQIIKLFKLLYDENIIHNYGDNKPLIYFSTGTSGSSGATPFHQKPTYKKITKKFDPHKVIGKCLKMKKRFKV